MPSCKFWWHVNTARQFSDILYLSIVHNIPNILSALRILLAPVFLLMYLQDELVWRSLSIAVFAIAAVTDYFDGYIARTYKAESQSGVFLDPLADKILTISGFLCLPFLDPVQFPWWAVLLIILRDLVITFLRVIADHRKMPMKTRFTAKLKTLVQMVFLYMALLTGVFLQADIFITSYLDILMQTDIPFWCMITVTLLTLYSGVEYLVINRVVIKAFLQRDPD